MFIAIKRNDFSVSSSAIDDTTAIWINRCIGRGMAGINPLQVMKMQPGRSDFVPGTKAVETGSATGYDAAADNTLGTEEQCRDI